MQEKTTYATRVNFKTASMIRPADSDDEQDKSDEDDGKSVAVKDDPQFTLAVTRGSVSICDFFAAFHTLEFLNAKMITYKT